MDYDASLRWLWTLPDFERTGSFATRPDVATMRALLAELGNPHVDPDRATVHIAGSKGKGSTAVMIEAILRACGGRIGTYVSPHLHRYAERIRIDGAPIGAHEFAGAMTTVRIAMERIAPALGDRELVAFDALTAAAFVAFRDAKVDAQVVEVGLGGMYDSTNVLDAAPHTVVITPISLEHTAILGSTIPEIAAQKAGIITAGDVVVVAPQRESALEVIHDAAREHGARIIEVAQACHLNRTAASGDAQDFKIQTAEATYAARLPLLGRHQLDNAATAIVACEEVQRAHGATLPPEAVLEGLAAVAWPGRMEVLKRAPLVVVDGAHNGDSAKRMVAALKEHFGVSQATFVFGTLAGKDVEAMAVAVSPAATEVYVTAWPSERGMDPRDAAEHFRRQGAPVTVFGDVGQAVEAAIAEAGGRGAVVAFGALAFVASVREYLLGIESDRLRISAAHGDASPP